MPASEYDTSVIELSLVIVFQLGFCLVLLAEIAHGVREYRTLLSLAGVLVGGLTMVGALLTVYLRRRFGVEGN